MVALAARRSPLKARGAGAVHARQSAWSISGRVEARGTASDPASIAHAVERCIR